MKNMWKTIIVCVVVIVFGGYCFATNDAPTFDAALEKLANYKDRGEVEAAMEGFEDIKSDYGNVSMFRMYAEAILNIHDGSYEGAIQILNLLANNRVFSDQLKQYNENLYLPSCEELVKYCTARMCEDQGDYLTALTLYEEVSGIWDSFSRYLDTDKKLGDYRESEYQRAEQLLEGGNYEEASEIFQKLGNYKDSEQRYELAMEPIWAEERYNLGQQQLEAGNYWEAAGTFGELGDYKDSMELYNNAIARAEAEDTAIEIIQATEPNTEVEEEDKDSRDLILPLAVDTYDNHTYAVFENAEYTWMQAEEYCNLLGGYLVTIKSEGEQRHIESLISRGTKGTFWIGGRRDEAGQFRWVDNDLVDQGYTHWDRYQPDNENTGRHEDYMQILRVYNPDATKMADGTSYSKKNRWNNNVNDNDFGTEFFSIHNVGFICEWDSIIDKYDSLGVDSKQVIEEGDYKIACFADDKYYLNIGGYRSPARDGRNVQIGYTDDGRIIAADAWTIEYDKSDGCYRISQLNQNVSLSIRDNSVSDGANVQAWTSNSDLGQKWEIYKNDDGSYRIKAKCSGLSLDIDGETIKRTSNVQQWSDKDSNAQKWVFIPFVEDTYFVKDVQSIVYLREKPNASEAIISEVPKGATVLSSGVIYEGFMCVVYNDIVGYIDYHYLERLEG